MYELEWIGSSLEDLKEFPEDVKDEVGYALYVAQNGIKPPNAKQMKGLGGVMEIISNYNTNTYRAIYAAKIGTKIYVLHCFQKKSKHGISTPKQEIELIKQRLAWAKQVDKEWKK